MPEFRYPGVYIEEAPVGPCSIEGTPTSTAGFVGFAQRGPINMPIVVASVSEFVTAFGKINASLPLSAAVESFFLNGGKRAVIVRAGSANEPRRRRARAGEITGQAEENSGLQALHLCREQLGLLLTPDAAFMSVDDAAQVSAAAAQFADGCNIFYICDVPDAVARLGPDAVVRWAGGSAPNNRNVAIYYPWLKAGGTRKAGNASLRPPSAIAAGIYASVDASRGVWKSPAGTDAVVTGTAGLAAKLSDAALKELESASINPILKIASSSIVLWGARTRAADDQEWRYVAVRRLGLFLENSISAGISWATFEPGGEQVWARIRLAVSSFLHTTWRAGAFQGARPQDAYFVRCDATTMTADDIANGHIVVLVGFAPMKPAEFVVLRIALTRA